MLDAREIKRRVDIHDLADKLGLERPGNRGNYKSPHHNDKTPSLTLYDDGGWTDWSTEESGSVIDLVMYVRGCDFVDALRELHDLYGWPMEEKKSAKPPSERTLAELIADQSLKQPERCREYLKSRGITDEIIDRAIKRRAVGFNDWTSPKKPAGEIGHGGPAVAFIVRALGENRVLGVDMRYLDPELNGGLKTSSQGEKENAPWFIDARQVQKARTVFVVESAINAMAIECCGLPATAAVATRGTKTVAGIDWRFLRGKRVIAAFDNDPPNERGRRPGSSAAWELHEILTGLGVSCLFVDQDRWNEFDYNDVADIIESEGPDGLRSYLHQIEPWIIPGLPGDFSPDRHQGKPRVYLPAHDMAVYWRFRAKADFVTYIKKREKDEETGQERDHFEDLCGFRVAAISRVRIQSATATLTGEEDLQPRTLFAVSVQVPRFGDQLQRRVFEDERLHNVDHWSKFGPVFARSHFLRMINILERAADIGAREAVNFVGLAWRNGKPVVNEGSDCYFNEPDKQCPYHNLSFPSGSRQDARRVIDAYQRTFRGNAASILLTWALGGHLKAYLDFYPHMVLQSSKGQGKTTLTKRMERSIAFTMFSGQSLQTEFRLLTSISHTSHPVGWEELSARRQDVIDKAVSMLQESYQFGLTRRGSDMTEYLQCAPVLLAGEDVPVKSLTGKLVRTDLTGKKGDMIPQDLPRFPVRQWLQHLADQGRDAVLNLMQRSRDYCLRHCAGNHEDAGARRMVENYAALLTAWKLLCDFAGIKDVRKGDFVADLIRTMNEHITETSADREPWVWILETALNEISSHQFRHPYKFILYRDSSTGERHECLLIRPSHIMDHISHTVSLRETWNGLPVKTARVLKQQLLDADVVYRERVDTTINRVRVTHMMALSLAAMGTFNLHATIPEDMTIEDTRSIDAGEDAA